MPKIFKKRKACTHKGDYGHVLIVAGSAGMTGAAYLASEAALLAGSGLVTCAIPKSINAIMARKLTEVMTLPLEDRGKGYFTSSAAAGILKFAKKVDVAAIGPGISQKSEVKKLVRKLIKSLNVPIVLDADGINCIAGEAQILRKSKKAVVVTPHPGEMSRLINRRVSHIQKNRKEIAQGLADDYGVTVVLKGMNTVVSAPGKRVYINRTGNPGMASGGVGDVLTGVIASLIGQGFSPFEAAKKGVYLHGAAGDIAAKEKGEASLTASAMLKKLPEAIKRMG